MLDIINIISKIERYYYLADNIIKNQIGTNWETYIYKNHIELMHHLRENAKLINIIIIS